MKGHKYQVSTEKIKTHAEAWIRPGEVQKNACPAYNSSFNVHQVPFVQKLRFENVKITNSLTHVAILKVLAITVYFRNDI